MTDDFDRFCNGQTSRVIAGLPFRPIFITQSHRYRRRHGATAPRSMRPRGC